MRFFLLLASACGIFLIMPITGALITRPLKLKHAIQEKPGLKQHKLELLSNMNTLIAKKVKELEHANLTYKDLPEYLETQFDWLCDKEEEFDWLCHTLSFHLASKSFVTRKVYGYPPTAGHGINDCIFAYHPQYDEKACNTLQNLIEHYDRKYNTWYPQELEKNITAQKELIAVGSSSLENNQNKLRRLLERKLTFSTFCSDADTVRAEQFTKAYLQYYEPDELAQLH